MRAPIVLQVALVYWVGDAQYGPLPRFPNDTVNVGQAQVGQEWLVIQRFPIHDALI
jgi:hypothetical protein